MRVCMNNPGRRWAGREFPVEEHIPDFLFMRSAYPAFSCNNIYLINSCPALYCNLQCDKCNKIL